MSYFSNTLVFIHISFSELFFSSMKSEINDMTVKLEILIVRIHFDVELSVSCYAFFDLYQIKLKR